MEKLPLCKQYFIMILIYVIAYMFCMQFAVKISQTEHPVYQKIDDMNKSCLYGCGENKYLQTMIKGRGNNYYISNVDDETKKRLKNCFLSFYNMTHFVMYFILGTVCPDVFYESLTIGLLFEGYEFIFLDCHDPLDIAYNTSGFLIGKYLSKYIYK